MKSLLNIILFFLGVVLLFFSIFKKWDYLAVQIFHLDSLALDDISYIELDEQEVFFVDVLSDDEQNCWYENNLQLVLYMSAPITGKYAHVKSLNVQDIVPDKFRLIVPTQSRFTVSSIRYDLQALYHLDDLKLSFFIDNVPVIPADGTAFNSELGGGVLDKSCCQVDKKTSIVNQLSCATTSQSSSAILFFRGFIHHDWKYWFDLENLSITHILHSNSDAELADRFRLKLRIRNKMLNDFRIIFADVPTDGVDNIVLETKPNNFSPYLSVHSGEYTNLGFGSVLELEFIFSVKFMDRSERKVSRLLEIEALSPSLQYPSAYIPGYKKITKSESSRFKFFFNFDLPASGDTVTIVY